MTYTEIIEYVEQWMEGHEPGTFVKNEYGAYIYRAGHSGINLPIFFQLLLEDFIEDKKLKVGDTIK